MKRGVGKLLYRNSEFILNPKANQVPSKFDTVLMVAGGSGITPPYQILQNILNNENDHTKVILLYANKTE